MVKSTIVLWDYRKDLLTAYLLLEYGSARLAADLIRRDLPDIESWLPADMDTAKTYNPCHDHRRNQCSTSFQEQRRLCQIIEKMLSLVFSARFNSACSSKKTCIDTINLELCRWQESLPNTVKCNKWEPSNTTLMMSVAALQ